MKCDVLRCNILVDFRPPLQGTCCMVVIRVNISQTELMLEIYFKCLVRAIGKVLLMEFS